MIGGRLSRFLCSLGAFVLLAALLQAHPVSMIQAEAEVHRDKIELKLAVMPEDFMYTYGIMADAQNRLPKDAIEKAARSHAQYLLDGLVIRDADGNRLQGKLVKTEMPMLADEGLPATDAMAVTFVYRLEYPLPKPPTHLSFQQHFGGDSSPIPSELDLTVTREGLPPEPPLQLSGEGNVETLTFDWDEKVRLGTGREADAAAVTEKRDRQQMGISSYATTYSFLYIQDEQVRLEILMPLVTLETWLPVPRAKKDFLDASEQTAAHDPLEKFFTSQNELQIDGVVVKPNLERLDFYGLDFRDFAARPEARRLSAWTARVGAILTYPAKGTPHRVDLKWTLFNAATLGVRTKVYAYDQGSRVDFLPTHPDFTWTNPGTPPLPKIEAVQAGAKLPDETGRAALAETLVRNVYRAFDYHNESDIYDALARSVHGDLLTDLYLKVRQGLTIQEQGGAVAHVQSVRVTKSEAARGEDGATFSERLTWQVEGTVEHWGHIHTRVNEYTAEFGLKIEDGAWKIHSMKVVKQSQVGNSIAVRKF